MRKPEAITPGPGDGQIRGACPLDCPDTCSWIVTVKNGEPVALRPAHPLHSRIAVQQGRGLPGVRSLVRSPAVSNAPHRTEGVWPVHSDFMGRVTRGSFFAVADVSDRIRPGVVASTKGRWPGCSKEGATINATVDDRDSDMGGGAL
jgi:hypothetical protein